MRGSNPFRTARARSLRRNSTEAERKLWSHLRGRRFGGLKFVRQESIGPYIADFVCRERRLIVEADGGQHATGPHDAVRDAFLTGQGYKVLRFWNNDVLANIDGVLETIADALRDGAAPHPDRFAIRPLPASGER